MKIKGIIYCCCLLGFVLIACSLQAQYTINGSVEGMSTGRALLVGDIYEGRDTLTKVEIKDGKFTMNGRVDEVSCAFLVVEGRMGVRLFLENNEVFDVRFKLKEAPEVRGGGRNQQLNREFMQIEEKKMLKLHDTGREFAEASKNRDTVAIREIREKQARILEELEQEKSIFLKRHGNTFFVLHDLARRALGMSAGDVQEAFDLCCDELKTTLPGKYITALLPKLAKIAVGATVPDFVSITPEGKEVSLYGIRSRIKLIDFWSSNCGRCREENRATRPIYERYHARGFEVISYSLDTKRELWLKAIADDKLPWIQVSDLGGQKMKIMIENYGIWSLPANLMVDENNRVIARNITSEELEKVLPKFLGIE
ncbi:TlpA disulfide reductase family protein [Butyricimonas sp. Marseille-P3923]|uniref:TlpA disulfide reductase family protein n=1 Tax=Butyricimonas sp. Marseille-P3923 TaxID=1987504 RepID=UPI000C0769CE|nr:TlpA disulfide reductase family protein [Butyricimonas sp. Marseille-P3923]